MVSGILKLAALVVAFFLAVFLAFQLLNIDTDFRLESLRRKCDILDHKGPILCDIHCYSKHQKHHALVYSQSSLCLYYETLTPFKIFEYFCVFQQDHKKQTVSVYLNFP